MSKLSTLLSMFYPEKCPYCSKAISHNEIACSNCISKFPEDVREFYANGGYKGYGAFIYDDIFSNAVKSFKFRNNPQYSKKLAVPMVKCVETLVNKDKQSFDYITFVPMHKKKKKVRGYNQSQLLAKDLSKLVNIQYGEFLCKIKDNPPQHSCTHKERIKNVRNVFDVINKENLKGKNILLVDDIITTGCTLGECARILRKAGARNVSCVTTCVVVFK